MFLDLQLAVDLFNDPDARRVVGMGLKRADQVTFGQCCRVARTADQPVIQQPGGQGGAAAHLVCGVAASDTPDDRQVQSQDIEDQGNQPCQRAAQFGPPRHKAVEQARLGQAGMKHQQRQDWRHGSGEPDKRCDQPREQGEQKGCYHQPRQPEAGGQGRVPVRTQAHKNDNGPEDKDVKRPATFPEKRAAEAGQDTGMFHAAYRDFTFRRK